MFYLCVLCVLLGLFFLVALVPGFSKQRPEQNRTVFQQPFGTLVESIGSLTFHVDRANHLALVVRNRNDDLRTCAAKRSKITRIRAHISYVHGSVLCDRA